MISSSIDYDPFEDITSIFSTKEALDDIDKLIATTRNFKLHLQEKLLVASKEIEKGTDPEHSENTVSTDVIEKVFKDFSETQDISSQTEATISNLTERISHLDNAKSNITQCLTLFQNLKALTDSYSQCKALLAIDSYMQMVSPYQIMCSLTENTFLPYKSVDEVNKLLTSIYRLQTDTIERIKQSYNRLFEEGNKLSPPERQNLETQLREGAGIIIDSDTSNKSKLIDWIIDKLLYEMTEIFQVDDEAGSLENLSRRYIFFKKVLNNFNTNFVNSFQPEWEMPIKLTTKFFQKTSKDLDLLLRREFKDRSKTPSIDLFMKALQTTLDFEKYINVRFSHKVKDIRLSPSFEPYLSLWVSHQDKMMEKKFLTYMSQEKISSNVTDSLIIPSSADLFRTYRSVLSQTLDLLTDNANNNILLALAKFFNKWLIDYNNKILRPLLLPDNSQIEDKRECSKYTVLLINTADYCSVTIEQLESKLSEFSSESDRISNVFDKTKNVYNDLLSRGNNLLLYRIMVSDISFAWKEFNNVDWTNSNVEDYSRYMVTLEATLLPKSKGNSTIPDDSVVTKKSIFQYIISLFNRDVYKWNFLDKVIDLITTDYLTTIIRLIEPKAPFISASSPRRKFDVRHTINIAEQLLLDMELLKQILNSLPEGIITDTTANSTQNTTLKRVQRHIDTKMELLLQFGRLLVSPLNSPDDYLETYKRLTKDNEDPGVWAYVFALKGSTWDLNVWKQYWTTFNLSLEDKEDTTKDATRNMFIFDWNKRLLHQFEGNLGFIQDPNWKTFISSDLHIIIPKRVVSRSQMNPQSQPTTKRSSSPEAKSPVLTMKELMSNTRFFNRGP